MILPQSRQANRKVRRAVVPASRGTPSRMPHVPPPEGVGALLRTVAHPAVRGQLVAAQVRIMDVQTSPAGSQHCNLFQLPLCLSMQQKGSHQAAPLSRAPTMFGKSLTRPPLYPVLQVACPCSRDPALVLCSNVVLVSFCCSTPLLPVDVKRHR